MVAVEDGGLKLLHYCFTCVPRLDDGPTLGSYLGAKPEHMRDYSGRSALNYLTGDSMLEKAILYTTEG